MVKAREINVEIRFESVSQFGYCRGGFCINHAISDAFDSDRAKIHSRNVGSRFNMQLPFLQLCLFICVYSL